MRKLAVVVASLILASGTDAAAQEMRHDLHSPSRSPEGAPGVNPGTTRGVDRGLSGPTPALEPRQELVSSTTTLTSANWAAQERPEDRARPSRTLLYTGGAIFLGSYAASAIASAIVGTDGDRWLAVPVAGPWIALGERQTSCGFGDCGFHEDVNLAGITASGVAQAAGLGLMITSLFISEKIGRF